MDLKEIIAVSGYSGLFKLVARGKNNIIVESLLDGKRMPVFVHDKANSLSDIAVFTTGEEIPLSDVFKRIYLHQDKKEISIDFKKNQNEMMKLFEQILPEYDKERVYPSDVRKIFTWYNILIKNNLIQIEETQTTESPEQIIEDIKENQTKESEEEEPKSKSKTKNTKKAKQNKEETSSVNEAKKAKSTTRKKKDEK